MTDWLQLNEQLSRRVGWQGGSVLATAAVLTEKARSELPEPEGKGAAEEFSRRTGLHLEICEKGLGQILQALSEPAPEPEIEAGVPSGEAATEPPPPPAEDDAEEYGDEVEGSEEVTEEMLSARSKAELYEIATSLNVDGRSSMSKGELIEAILDSQED